MTAPDPLAWATMVAYCGWDPGRQFVNDSVTLDGSGSAMLALPCMYVTGVTSVTLTLDDGSTWTPTVGAGNQIGWSTNGCLTWNPYIVSSVFTDDCDQTYTYWPTGQGNVTVVYSGGYDGLPDDLDAAVSNLSVRIPKLTSGLSSARLGSAAFTYAAPLAAGALLWVEQTIFDKYRLPKVA